MFLKYVFLFHLLCCLYNGNCVAAQLIALEDLVNLKSHPGHRSLLWRYQCILSLSMYPLIVKVMFVVLPLIRDN